MADQAGTQRPGASARDRDAAADGRDVDSDAHDRLSEARDEQSDQRDRRADERERQRTTTDQDASIDREAARRDRQSSAGDRKRAGGDRDASLDDRDFSAHERLVLVLDGLTGALRRDAGLVELAREVVRAHRTGRPFVLAFVDVDGLKERNDTRGHAAGDDLLKRVTDTIRGHVRAYDLIVRHGGDEFLCGISDLPLSEATRRFEVARSELAGTDDGSMSVGLAELGPTEALHDLIGRADAAMYAERRRHRAG